MKTPHILPPVDIELMRRRLADSLTLEELADVAGLSPFHFARQFKAATGHPPHDYHIRLRVDRAQELIRHHGREWTMAVIAQETGFADQSHMARHFKRVLGVSPRELPMPGRESANLLAARAFSHSRKDVQAAPHHACEFPPR